MPFNIDDKLVIGLASSALFDLEESDAVFRKEGENEYRAFQRSKQHVPLGKGVAFEFIQSILKVNDVDPINPPIEVVMLSRNDPDAGMRVMNSINFYNLKISRALFMQGRSPYKYIPALNICLFLSGNEVDVNQATRAGYPAGLVLGNHSPVALEGDELRIAFDFDGVIIDDESEAIFASSDLDAFHRHESRLVDTPHNPGPLKQFLERLSVVQHLEEERAREDLSYKKKIRISIVTARNAPSHERAINTMRNWKIDVNEAFFLGGIEKKRILDVMRPHIFFDDQRLHLDPAASSVASVHVPFGIKNQRS